MLVRIDHFDLQEVTRLSIKEIVDEHQPIDFRRISRRAGNRTLLVHSIDQYCDFPPDLRAVATSCRIEGVPIPVDGLLELLVESLQAVGQMPFDALRAEWLAAGAKEEDPEL